MAGAAALVRPDIRTTMQDDRPLPLVSRRRARHIHEAATGALRAQERRFEIVCTSSNFAVLAAAAAAGLGVMPMIEGLAPEGLRRAPTRIFRLCRRSRCCCWRVRKRLALASRRWVASMVETLQSE